MLVIVSVLDQNDNGPVIIANDTDKTIEENQAPGQLVFVIDVREEGERERRGGEKKWERVQYMHCGEREEIMQNLYNFFRLLMLMCFQTIN